MFNYVYVTFPGSNTRYKYRLPDNLKTSIVKVGSKVIVPAGNNNELKVVTVKLVQSFDKKTNDNFPIKEAYGLVKKLDYDMDYDML